MGANASTAVPVYASGQVLDAARLNLTNSGIPVFSGTATRDAAFGGSGEKVLAEGQVVYLEDTDALQYYSGTSFVAVGASSGLTLISTTTFTTAASVSLPANTFSATYENYLLVFDTTAISTTMTVTGRFRAAGTDNSSAEYSNMLNIVDNAGGGNTSVSTSSQTSFNFQFATTSRPLQGLVNVQSPFATKISVIFPQMACQSSGGSNRQIMQGAGQFGLTTSFDSFSFIASTGTFTGTVRAYGYANS